jgi:hypothetical protein
LGIPLQNSRNELIIVKTKPFIIITISLVLIFFVFYVAYRVYHVEQTNLRLEHFMAEQIIPIQDKWFEANGRPKQNEYFIVRTAPFYFKIREAVVDGSYRSYWLSTNGNYRQMPTGEYYKEAAKEPNGTLTWVYIIQPLSGSIVCIGLEAHKPNNWTAGGMGSVAGSTEWIVDTSKSVWQLEPYNSGCPRSDTDIIGVTLLSVH